jgi:DNA-binding XRE family transcriptional regulator
MSTLNEPSSVDASTNPIPIATAHSEGRTLSRASEILEYLMRDDAQLQRMVERAKVEAILGQAVYEAREEAGLTRDELAERVGVTPDTIEDVEEGDYEGDALTLIGCIAKALKARIVVALEQAE